MLQELPVSLPPGTLWCFSRLNWYNVISSQSPRFLSCDSVISRVTRLCNLGCESQQIQEMFLCSNTSNPALRPTQLPTHWILGALFLVVQQPRHELEHSLSSSTKVNNDLRYTSTPHVSLHGACRKTTFSLDDYVVFQHQACLKHLFICRSNHEEQGNEVILCFFDSRASYLQNFPAQVNYGTSEFLMYRAGLCIWSPHRTSMHLCTVKTLYQAHSDWGWRWPLSSI
jgi:hypothetical protein